MRWFCVCLSIPVILQRIGFLLNEGIIDKVKTHGVEKKRKISPKPALPTLPTLPALPYILSVPPKNSQLFFFTGENTFALGEELKRWKASFLEKHGEANLHVFDAKNLAFVAFANEAKSAPFLSDKRLLIVEGIPPSIQGVPVVTKDDLETLLSEMHEGTVIVFVEPIPDKRTGIVKFLLKEATVRLFSPLSKQHLIPWIRSLGKSSGVNITEEVASEIVGSVGTDQWSLRQECLKVLSFAAPDTPTVDQVKRVCLPSGTHAVWVLNDMIGKGKTEEAALYGAKLWESGEDAYSLWNLLLYIVRNIAILWIFQKEKNLSGAALAKESGVNVLSVQSLLPLVASLSEEKVCAIVESAVAADHALKSGEIRATAQNSIELVTMLERQLLGLRA